MLMLYIVPFHPFLYNNVRYLSLIMGRGGWGLQNGKGAGQVKGYPYKKGSEKVRLGSGVTKGFGI